jgi:hypothetical protein
MILVDGDPLQRSATSTKVKIVVKDAVVFQAADLDKAIGVKPL